MRVLWSVNTLMPQVSERIGVKSGHAISWVDAMSSLLKEDTNIKLAIATVANIRELQIVDIEKIRYYVMPIKKEAESWKIIIDNFMPDVVHLYGTEQTHNIPLIRMGIKVPIIISLQGILKGYERAYYGGIDVSTILHNITIRDIIKGTLFKERDNFKKRSLSEAWQLNHVRYVEGRSTWDKVYALSINPKLEYFYCPRLIREPFYKAKWGVDIMEPHSIFVHQGNYPIKGLHFVFEAMSTLIEKYPDVKLYVAGKDIINKHSIKEKLKRSGYSKYLISLYKKYNLSDHVVFLGIMTAREVADRLSKTNVMVIPSAIENCPNSLAEAMLVGTPSVASYVGGNAELLNNGQCGKLYCYSEPLMLANCIDEIFSSLELAQQYSLCSQETALKRHDPATLKSTLLGIYDQIISKFQVAF